MRSSQPLSLFDFRRLTRAQRAEWEAFSPGIFPPSVLTKSRAGSKVRRWIPCLAALRTGVLWLAEILLSVAEVLDAS